MSLPKAQNKSDVLLDEFNIYIENAVLQYKEEMEAAKFQEDHNFFYDSKTFTNRSKMAITIVQDDFVSKLELLQNDSAFINNLLEKLEPEIVSASESLSALNSQNLERVTREMDDFVDNFVAKYKSAVKAIGESRRMNVSLEALRGEIKGKHDSTKKTILDDFKILNKHGSKTFQERFQVRLENLIDSEFESVISKVSQLSLGESSESDMSLQQQADLVTEEDIIGEGCNGTQVFRGKFGGRQVAVKMMSLTCVKAEKVRQEVNFLIRCDQHENVVRYFDKEYCPSFIYLAFELCDCSLADWVKKPELHCKLKIDKLEILKQATKGVGHLHLLKIVHRDLKPENILMKKEFPGKVVVKIADFGISRQLPQDRSRMTTTEGEGSEGWMAPEILRARAEDRAEFTCSTDIFSLGCVFHFVLTEGHHPFGDDLKRQYNIGTGNYSEFDAHQLDAVKPGSSLLVKSMVALKQKERPPTSAIRNHHIFWNTRVQLEFLLNVSNCVEGMTRNDIVIIEDDLQKRYTSIVGMPPEGGDWISLTCPTVQNFLLNNRHRTYKGASAIQLVRAVRNMCTHYGGLPKEVQTAVGSLKEGFGKYWFSRFPNLVENVWAVFQKMKAEPTESLGKYYCEDFDFVMDQEEIECRQSG